MIEIRKLTAADAETFRDIRVRSVREHPEAYLASDDEEAARTVEQYRQRLADKEGKADDVIFAAFDDGQAVGLAGAHRPAAHRRKGRHLGRIWGVYVAPEARGQGVGTRLMHAAIDALRNAGGIELIELGVAADNRAALALYRSIGFQSYGLERHAIKLDDGRYVDEELMVFFF